jgi:outer membrane receptor for ferrienterochelin and colicin
LITSIVWQRTYANNESIGSGEHPFYVPGTPEFDSAFNSIISRESFSEGGSKFYDRSALYHIHGEYKFTPKFVDIAVGANFRVYKPNSRGTIFSDTSEKKITNNEYGVYAGIEKRILKDQLKLNATLRMDKNENFDYLFSPAASAVYLYQDNVFRASFSSAIRNPTLTDQYLYYDVGNARLGNITGFDSLVTIASLLDFLHTFTI